MKLPLRVVGWLLLGMGTVLSLVTGLALAGIIQLQIDFFGLNVDTRTERIALLAALVIAAIAGFTLLRVSKRPPAAHSVRGGDGG